MTPTQIETAARRKYNAVSDTFFAQAEILDLIYFAEVELCRAGFLIEGRSTSTSTVIGTRSYAFPSNYISIKRVLYNGMKLKPIDMREDDMITALDEGATDQGTPQYYTIWNETLYLRPIPDAVQTLTIYGYKEPAIPTILDTLEIPSEFHLAIVDYVVSEIAAKDSNFTAASYYRNLWDGHVEKAKRWRQVRYRQDSFKYVKDEEELQASYLGTL